MARVGRISLLLVWGTVFTIFSMACSVFSPVSSRPESNPGPIDNSTDLAVTTNPGQESTTLLPTETLVAPTSESSPSATPPSRAYAHDAANLMELVDLSQLRPLQPEAPASGQISANSLAVPFTYTAQAGEILFIELLLPDLTQEESRKLIPAIFIADSDNSEIGYIRGGNFYTSRYGQVSMAQAGLVVPTTADYTILATLDGHQAPGENPVSSANFQLRIISAVPIAPNEPVRATRDSTERHIYALQTKNGNFQLDYEDLAGTPPGQYSLSVYRLGSPSDPIGLQQTQAAGGEMNTAFAHRDPALGTILEGMGLEEATYFIIVDSFVLEGEELATYTSDYKLTIVQDAPSSQTLPQEEIRTTSVEPDDSWITHLNHPLRVQYDLPPTWKLVRDKNTYQDGENSLSVWNPGFYQTDLAVACQQIVDAYPELLPGTGSVQKINSDQICVVTDDQSGEPLSAIFQYPTAIETAGNFNTPGTWYYLILDIQPAEYFWPIVESVQLSRQPNASFFLEGVVEVMQANYLFRDEVDWKNMAADLSDHVGDSKSLDDAYNALRWMMNELFNSVDHHHMVLRTPEQVRTAQQGQTMDVGLQVINETVARVTPGGSGQMAGVQVGDKIITVNGAPYTDADFSVDTFSVVFDRDGERYTVTLEPQPVQVLIQPNSWRTGDVVYLETFGIDFGAPDYVHKAYATTLHTTLKALDMKGTCGWVLDLRRNFGGRGAPIMAGIAPLVGEGELLRKRLDDGQETILYYENGSITNSKDQTIEQMVDFPYELINPNPPVAILVSHGTGSGGEGSAIIVNGQPGAITRIFGETTRGLTTFVPALTLFDGGQFLFPATQIVDASGNTYPDGVIPDVPMDVIFDERYGTQDDPLVQAALIWLVEEQGCSR